MVTSVTRNAWGAKDWGIGALCIVLPWLPLVAMGYDLTPLLRPLLE
jgi:hypothetical protein